MALAEAEALKHRAQAGDSGRMGDGDLSSRAGRINNLIMKTGKNRAAKTGRDAQEMTIWATSDMFALFQL